jgi:hypothetical protein
MRLCSRLWLVLGLLFFWGCGGSGPSISGTVRVDGQPLARGWIKFIPLADTPGPDAGATIEEGKYRITKGLRPGDYRIEIQGTRRTPKKVLHPMNPAQMIQDEVAVVAAEFNQNSTLTRTVKPGTNAMDFDVKGLASKGARPGK